MDVLVNCNRHLCTDIIQHFIIKLSKAHYFTQTNVVVVATAAAPPALHVVEMNEWVGEESRPISKREYTRRCPHVGVLFTTTYECCWLGWSVPSLPDCAATSALGWVRIISPTEL